MVDSSSSLKRLESLQSPDDQGFIIAKDDIVYGNIESKTIIVEYFSPTCPHCVTYYNKMFPEIKKNFIDTGKIAYVTREFIGNKQDLDATILARCLGGREKYKLFMKIILEQQANWAFSKNYREILTNIGVLGGISPKQYGDCLNDKKIIQRLMKNTLLVSKQPNFVGTPIFFINGKHYDKPYTVEELSEAITKAIKANERRS